MASPVDTSVKHFLSSMTGAPALSGTVGSYIALLDALLVTGFDTKTLTSLTVSGGVATAAFSGQHSAIVDSVILVAGVAGGPAGWAGHNGEQKVTAVGAGVVRFATTLPDGTYTGTITIKMAPAGWIKAYTGTNIAVYQSADPQSSKMLLRVDDTSAQWARVRGFETMQDANTGTGLFPLDSQQSGGGYWPKASTANSNPVGWAFAADSRFFYISTLPGTANAANRQIGNIRAFGDPVVTRPSGDAYACLLNYSTSGTSYSQYDNCLSSTSAGISACARAYSGLGSCVLHKLNVWGAGGVSPTQISGITNVHGAFPNPIDGGLYLTRRVISTTDNYLPRAEIPGSYQMLQSAGYDSFRYGDKVPGTGALTGKTLVAVHGAGGSNFDNTSSSGNTSVLFIDVTGPWR
jgi:hypothetical protein